MGIRSIFSVIDDSIALTPQKAVGILRQAEYGDPWLMLELAERMEEKDLLYQGVLHTRKMAVTQLDFDVQAGGDDSQALDDADFIRDILIDSNQIDLHDVVYEMLDALGKGFSATEINWDTNGHSMQTGAPEWLPFELKWRDPRWFMFDFVSGEQLLVRTLSTDGPQIPVGRDAWDSRLTPMNLRVRSGGMGHEIGIQPATQPLAPFKFITHITRAKAGLPIRGGLARIAIWCYLFKNYLLKDWVVFAEVYGEPLRLGKYGPGATENDKAALLRAVANIGTDAAAIIPESMAIEFVESKGGGQKSHEMYQKFCEYLDKLLTIGILGQELTTQLPRGSGSRAAAQVHDIVRRDIATDDARRVSASLNRDLVKPLIDLNRGPRARYPRISIGFNEKADLTELMTGLGQAVDRGLRVSEKWLRDQFGAPDPQEGEPLLHPIERISLTSAPGEGPAAQPGAPNGHPQPGQPGNGVPLPQRGNPPNGGPQTPAAAISDTNLSPEFTDVNGHREESFAKKKSSTPTRKASENWKSY
jgi:phage gp29-like protein